MNKYTAIGLSYAAAIEGSSVLLVTDPWDLQTALNELSAVSVFSEGARVRRANGAERIDYPSGGRVSLCTARACILGRARGISADVVFIDSGVDERSPDLLNALHPVVAAAGGEIIRS